jgi:2-amino-4-hydroxy-6-hydroxymethyldihydropteridine diphosphokinase
MPQGLIGLGSNVGRRRHALEEAVDRLGRQREVVLGRRSGWYPTRPVGGPAGQPSFYNGAVLLETSLAPQALYALLRRIEDDLGRRRAARWGPRTIDLDLLLFDRLVLQTPELVIPHPRMAWRRFVLEPAAQIAAEMVHPQIGWSIGQLLTHLNTAVNYVAIGGPPTAGKTLLAEALVQATGATLVADAPEPRRPPAAAGDSAGIAGPAALESIRPRGRRLAVDAPLWAASSRLVVSDFWFDESLDLARAWLPPERFEAFQRDWERERLQVVPPKLLVLLDAPGEELYRRLAERDRGGPPGWTVEQLQRIRGSIVDRALRPGLGPVLRLTGLSQQEMLVEVLAAVQSMS